MEIPSSLALTAGSNLGAPLSESSTTCNGTGNSFQSACRRESDEFRITSGLHVLNHPWDARPFDTMIGSMAPALVRSGPIVPCLVVLTGLLEPCALKAVAYRGSSRLVLPWALFLFFKIKFWLFLWPSLAIGLSHSRQRSSAIAPTACCASERRTRRDSF